MTAVHLDNIILARTFNVTYSIGHIRRAWSQVQVDTNRMQNNVAI